MLAKFRPRSVYDVMAALALFVALSTGGAYASHLVVNSSDVVDESLTGADVKGKAATSTTAAVNGSLTGNEISGQLANAALGQSFVDGSLTTADVKANTLTGGDINEATLAKVPAATTADKLGGVAAKPAAQFVGPGATDHNRCTAETGVFCSATPAGGTDYRPWRNLGDPWAPAAYSRDAVNMVHIEGVVLDPAAMGFRTGRIFVLPAGYRPAASHIFIVTGREIGDVQEANGRVDVHANGDVVMSVRPDSNPSLGSDLAHLSLDGISFRAA